MNDEIKIKKLLNRGFSYLGMIHEARAKCLLLKERVKKVQQGIPLEDESLIGFHREMRQIEEDLTKYSRRLAKVHEELKGYGVFSDLE